jgi:NitT/TauT family transport system permease protein
MSGLSLENDQPKLTSRRRVRAFDTIVLVLVMLSLWQVVGSWTQGVAVSPPLQTLVYLFGIMLWRRCRRFSLRSCCRP